MTVVLYQDRSLSVRPDQVVKTSWVDADACVLGNRARMSPEAVTEKYRKLLCLGENAAWPPIVGHWRVEDGRFVVCDGRHEFLASLMLGRSRVFVAWLEDAR